ncbi:MAG: YbhB/YbcL family Raf kinase inhibitor-like protein, partial [Candidatus Omnitrophota bacterium]|nr:YbhB/YbcL family Raf kinase inhibitor-like protein [Candidatus Omnitrophota bacterium]
MNKIKWFINDFFTRHSNATDRLFHFVGIPQAFFGIFQLLTGQWKWGLANLFLGYLWQWIGHKYFEKNEVGEVILIKKIIAKIKKRVVASIFLVCVLFIGGDAMALMIKSSAFNDGDTMPARYTCKGEDISPPLMWEHSPDGTASFVIICDDPDAPMGTWSHWVIYNILKGINNLPEGVPPYDEIDNGAKQGMNDFRRVGYGGP